ncbi:MAG: Na+/H+ antiporter subunit G [Deltaproteobacteria bacterium]|nr:Na+/H+ antiporter subunit G [Deltaproteobacteria bacterium]
MTTTAIIGYVVIAMGVVFLFLGGLGILRFPDVYNRLQAGTKCTTFGAFFTVIGVGIAEPTWFFKTLVIGVFILLTNPISAHAIARASIKSGLPLWNKSVVDKYSETKKCKEFDEDPSVQEGEA